MARKSGFIRRHGRMIRESTWLNLGAAITNLSGPSTAVLGGSLNAAALALRPFTVVRTHGFFGIRTDQIAADESYDAAMGWAVVSDQAVAVGVTAVPTPMTDLGSDLFYAHRILMGRFEFASSVGIRPDMLTPWVHYDSKAMRKVDGDQDVIFVLETSAVSSGCTVHDAARFLIKLH